MGCWEHISISNWCKLQDVVIYLILAKCHAAKRTREHNYSISLYDSFVTSSRISWYVSQLWTIPQIVKIENGNISATQYASPRREA